VPFQDLLSRVQPNDRTSRIKEAWDRATSIGLLGAMWIASEDVANATLIPSAAAEETNATDPTPAAKLVVVSQADQAPSAVQVQVETAGDVGVAQPDAATNQDSAGPANETTEAKEGPSAQAHGSSTSVQLIEETLASQSLSELLHQVGDEPSEPAPLVAAETTSEPVEWSDGVTIHGTDAADVLVGTLGADILIGGAGDDHLQGRGGGDAIRGGAGDDTIEGGSGDDIASGGSGNDKVSGASGNDMLDGGSGNDALQGGSGDDVVIGGLGGDWLIGGEGADSFKFTCLDDSGTTEETRDRILDFKQGEDKIDLVKINADSEALADLTLVFVGLEEFGLGRGQLRYQQFRGDHADDDRTLIELSNGDGHAHMQVELHGLFTMTVDDFLF
jgi:Ca2+-binding RTX toxin-like protein